MAECGDGALQGMQHFAITPAVGRVGTQRRERLGGQIFQSWAAVDQQSLDEQAAQPVLAAQRSAVSPLVQKASRLTDRRLNGVGAENQAGQAQPVEVAQVLESGNESTSPAISPGQATISVTERDVRNT
ncbi:hypothetical protein ACWDKQ_35895 [Saccharopolyspora sp. NPDC000995]